ncbi:hypothetical protein F8M41_019344 [Gigaspora margarita]|uniref:Uncharacterized protein n=1 Tax=Gigaspora margarita TaxID=4874 RepID=A0A8H4EKP3_GIGMA|nr:hypothetical protein F8M41_019344 [Gigaspora margarita]
MIRAGRNLAKVTTNILKYWCWKNPAFGYPNCKAKALKDFPVGLSIKQIEEREREKEREREREKEKEEERKRGREKEWERERKRERKKGREE